MPHLLPARPWHREGLPGWFELLLVLAMGFRCLVRGIDYLTGDSVGASTVLGFAERSAPLTVWGGCFIAAGIIILAAVPLRCLRTLIVGIAVAAATWTVLSVAMLVMVTAHGMDGVRAPADTLGMAVLSGAYVVVLVVRHRLDEIREEGSGAS